MTPQAQGFLHVVVGRVLISVLLRYPLERHPLTRVFLGETGLLCGGHIMPPPGRVVSNIDALWVQARTEGAVEDPKVAGCWV